MIPLTNQLRTLFVSGVVFASIATLPQFLLFRNCADLVKIFLAHMGGQLCLATEAGSTCCALSGRGQERRLPASGHSGDGRDLKSGGER